MDAPVVMLDIDCGVRGKIQYTKDHDKPVYTYLGVPYAEPPVGPLRFRPAAPLKLWKGIRDASKFGASCPQNRDLNTKIYPRYPPIEDTSEDCLFVNVYTPRLQRDREQRDAKALPVMVWIHGGGLFCGTGNIYDGTVLAAKHDVIVVTFNYRLNIFGFLASPDGYFGGNMGLLDQVEALRWVQTYISKFGGDPTNVTIFGESAGGQSVHLHMVSPVSQGLFTRAICQSGTALYNGMALSMTGNTELLKRTFESFDIDITNGKEMEALLFNMDAEEIISKFFGMYRPVIGDQFLPLTPLNHYKKNGVNPVDLLCGFTSDEGLLMIDIFFERTKDVKFTWNKQLAAEVIEEFIRSMLIPELPKSSIVCKEITQFYLDGCDNTSASIHQRISELIGEGIFKAPKILMTDLQSKNVNTFLYEFRHRPCFTTRPSGALADHTDDIPYVFGEPYNPLFNEKWQAEDVAVSDLMMTYWANFAKTGNPNGPNVPKWPTYDCDTQEYLAIQSKPDTYRKYKPDAMDLWNRITEKTHTF